MKFETEYLKIKKKYNYLFKIMNKQISNKRKKHILGVAKMSYLLSKKYKKNQYMCILASCFHDFFREIGKKNILKLVDKYSIKMDFCETNNPDILHGMLAAKYFMEKKIIIIPEILNAIKNHTTGNINMDAISKIIFISDAIEENRVYKEVNLLRNYVFSNSLENSFFYILKKTIENLLFKNYLISSKTIMTYNEQIKNNINI